jgi:hypothetical protein
MNGELILFEGKEVRTFEEDGGVWMALKDLALAWGLDETTLIKHVERRMDFFEGCTRDVDILSTDEKIPCINEEGLYLLIARVSLKKIKNHGAKESIIRFRKMAPKVLQGYRKKEIVQVPVATSAVLNPRIPPEEVREALKMARVIAEETGVNILLAQSFALEKAGAGDWQQLLAPGTATATGYLTPTDIGRMIGKTAQQVNIWLYQSRLQDKDRVNGWRLTEAGKAYATEEHWSNNGHEGIQIHWHESILAKMNVNTDQGTLAKAG